VAFTPAETTVAGGSLSYQAFVTRVTQFILWCKDNFNKDLEAAELQNRLERAFALFWERSGHLVPTSLVISTGQPGPDGGIPLRIVIEPSRQILPSGEKMEMEFVW
jgi:hypothetical protein